MGPNLAVPIRHKSMAKYRHTRICVGAEIATVCIDLLFIFAHLRISTVPILGISELTLG